MSNIVECPFCGEDVTPQKGLCPVCSLKISGLVSAVFDNKITYGKATMGDLEGAEIVISFDTDRHKTYELTYRVRDNILTLQEEDEDLLDENTDIQEYRMCHWGMSDREFDFSKCSRLKDVADLILTDIGMQILSAWHSLKSVILDNKFKFVLYDESHTRKYTSTKVLTDPLKGVKFSGDFRESLKQIDEYFGTSWEHLLDSEG